MQNQIPNNWQKVKLEELIHINPRQMGASYPYGDIEYIDISSVGTGTLETTMHYKLSNAPGRAKRLVMDGDTIISTVRPNRRSFLFIKQPKDNLIVSTGFAVLSPKPNMTDSKFLYYLITRQSFTDYLSSNVRGSAYPVISTDVIGNAETIVPNYPEQKRIASILSAFDDKIELNNKIAKNLEEIAQTIFKEWFVKFKFPGYEKVEFVDCELGKIPSGWEIISLKDIVDLISDRYIGNNNKDRMPYLPIDLIQPKTLLLKETAPTEEAKSSLIKFIENDILFGAMRPYFFKVSIAPFIGLSRTTCFVFRPKVKDLLGYATFFLFRQETIDYATNLSQGSTIPYARWNGALAEMNLLKPSPELLQLFNMIALPVIENIKSIYFENQKLAALRDLLLPKLMKGEIKV